MSKTYTSDEGLQRSATRNWKSAAPWLALAVAAVLRGWPALSDHSIYWPDEIYQSLEQAHRVAFGYGVVPWEFRDGARSWLFPGAIAVLWKVASVLGVTSSLTLVALARMGMVAASLSAIWLAWKIARRLSGERAAWVTALVLATLPAGVVFGYRTLTETASAPFVMLGVWALTTRSDRSATLAGWSLGLATLLRYQNVVVGIALGVWLLAQKRSRHLVSFSAGAVACALCGGLLDWMTWGRPFHSLLVYLEFNLVRDGASTFGVEGPWYYLRSLWTSTGPLSLPLAVLALVGAWRQRPLGLVVLAFLLIHSIIPHKELRFIMPCLPLFAILVGAGAEAVMQRVGRWRWCGDLVLVVVAGGSAIALPELDYARMGQYAGTPRQHQIVWHADEEANLLLSDVGQEPDLCGLGVLGLRAAFTGGYTYLHRDAPLFYGPLLCDLAPSVNYVVTPLAEAQQRLPSEYAAVARRGPLGLFKRDGQCAPPPASHDRFLEGAHNMGLWLPPARQRDDGSLHLDPIRDSGSFVRGWGNGEVIECRPARWAVAKRAVVEFRSALDQTAYRLFARLAAYEGVEHQHLALLLNGRELYDGALSPNGTDFAIDVPPTGVVRGLNQLELKFGQTGRPGGNDIRDLAGRLMRLDLVPTSDDFDIDLDHSEVVEHLGPGFSPPERDPEGVTFAWNEGRISEVTGRLSSPSEPHVFSVVAQAIPNLAPLSVRVTINQKRIADIVFSKDWGRQAVLVPSDVLRAGPNVVRLEYERTAVPAEVSSDSTDTRELAVRYRSLQLMRLPELSRVDFGTAEARRLLLQGWSVDEVEDARSSTWTVGQRASMLLRGDEGSALEFDICAYARALPLNVEVVVNGTSVGTLKPNADWATHRVAMSAGVLSSAGNVVEFRLDRTARPLQYEPGSRDDRELGLRVDQLRLVP